MSIIGIDDIIERVTEKYKSVGEANVRKIIKRGLAKIKREVTMNEDINLLGAGGNHVRIFFPSTPEKQQHRANLNRILRIRRKLKREKNNEAVN